MVDWCGHHLSATYEEVDRILAEADETDAEEDARFGQARGDEVPQELTDPVTRRERLECAKRELEAEQAARVAEHEAMLARRAEHRERTGRNPRGRPPGDGPGPEPPADAKRNITDPDSRIMRDRGAHVQAYNAQAVVGEGRVILAADVTTGPNDSHQLLAMLRATRENLQAVGHEAKVKCVHTHYTTPIDHATKERSDGCCRTRAPCTTTRRASAQPLTTRHAANLTCDAHVLVWITWPR